MQQSLASPQPPLQFRESVTANLSYWQKHTRKNDWQTINHERQNIYRAIRFGLYITTCWRQTAELMLQLFVLIEQNGYWAEWLPLLEELLERCEQQDVALRGQILDQLGIFYRYNQQLDQALATHQEELQLGRNQQDKWRQAHAYINLGVVYRQLRCFDQADANIHLAAQTFQAIDAPSVKHAFVAQEWGLLAQDQQQWSTAEAYYNEATALWRAIDAPFYLANCLKLLGEALIPQQKIPAAKVAFDEALQIFRKTQNELDQSRLLNELGILYLEEGDAHKARQLLFEADSPFLRQSGSIYDQAIVTNNLGNIYLAQDDVEAAANAFQRSIALWEMCEDKLQLANALGGFAEVQAAQGKIKLAQKSYNRAIALTYDFPDDIWAQQLQQRMTQEKEALSPRTP